MLTVDFERLGLLPVRRLDLGAAAGGTHQPCAERAEYADTRPPT
jgi:hypothetical protein